MKMLINMDIRKVMVLSCMVPVFFNAYFVVIRLVYVILIQFMVNYLLCHPCTYLDDNQIFSEKFQININYLIQHRHEDANKHGIPQSYGSCLTGPVFFNTNLVVSYGLCHTNSVYDGSMLIMSSLHLFG